MKRNLWENRYWYIAMGILLVSIWPMFLDILKFLPDYKTDENEIVEYAVGFMGGDMDQRFYSYGPLFAYILTFIYKILSWFSPGGADDFVQKVFFDNTIFYYTARFLNSIFALGTGWVIFKISERLWGRKLAYWALGLLVFPFAELLTVFTPRVDLLLGLSYALCLYFMVRYYDSSAWKDFFISAFFAGLGFAIKPLPSLLISPSLLLALLFLQIKTRSVRPSLGRKNRNDTRRNKRQKRKTRVTAKRSQRVAASASPVLPIWKDILQAIPSLFKDKRLYIFGGAAILAAFIFFPHAFINWSGPNGFWAQQVQRISYEGGKKGIPGWRLDVYLVNLGYLFTFMGVTGVFVGWIRAYLAKEYLKMVVFTLPIIFLLVFMRGPARVYWYAALPYFLVLGIVDWMEWIFRRIPTESKRFWVGVMVLFLLIAQPGYGLFQRSMAFNASKDYASLRTALAARKWVESHIPTGASIAMYGYYVNLPRIVTRDVSTQASIGEYFMYYRGKNKYYLNLFRKAHAKYINDPSHRTYRLMNTLSFLDQNGKKQVLPLRSRNKSAEKQLLPILRANKANYFISNYEMPKNWEKFLVQSFRRKDYVDGMDVFIYRLDK